jgi:hypothetical protein
MRGGATEVNESQKRATSRRRLRTTGLEDRRIGLQFPLGAEIFVFCTVFRPTLLSSGNREPFSRGGKTVGRAAAHSPQFIAEHTERLELAPFPYTLFESWRGTGHRYAGMCILIQKALK